MHALQDDAELITQVQSGDVEAFGELYRRYLNPIYRYIRARVSDDRVAEDLTESVFLRSFEALERYKEKGWPFSAFLYRVAKNLLVDHYRRQREEAPLEAAERVASSSPGLEDHILQFERTQELQAALDDLPPDYQEVIRLRVVLAMPTAEVSTWMGRSEGAVRVLLHRALNALREKVVQQDEGDEQPAP